MTVYRLVSRSYIDDLTGTGAYLFGGRWNPKGIPCIYTSTHISLAMLEKFVHTKAREELSQLMLLQLDIPDDDDHIIYYTDTSRLKADWMDDIDYSQWFGQQILANSSILAFVVPSAIVPEEQNMILNPSAINFSSIRIAKPRLFQTDFRLISRMLWS